MRTRGESRATLGEGLLQGISGFLDPLQGFNVNLRGCSKGQERSGIAGGEESRGGGAHLRRVREKFLAMARPGVGAASSESLLG